MALTRVLNKRERGNSGEDVACVFLNNHGFQVIERNFSRKWGELDIIATKDKKIHFFEVKSVTYYPSQSFSDTHRPEENVDNWKIKHIRRMVYTYLDHIGLGIDTEFEFHVLCVYMNLKNRRAKVEWLQNVIL